MRRATTPKLTIAIDTDLRGCWYRVTLAQNYGPKIIKDQDECELSEDGKTIYVKLTQRETLQFSDKYKIKVQVRYGIDDSVCASNIATITIDEILDEEVI